MLFWLAFLAAVGGLYAVGVFDRAWIFFFFAFSDFCVYFAVFFWCPFHRIIIRPSCCMECRIFNWDSFFSYSFLLFLPSVYSIILVGLALCSLVEWEITYHKYPKRFYRMSNQKLTCENCDLEACKNHHKKRFHRTLCENETGGERCKPLSFAALPENFCGHGLMRNRVVAFAHGQSDELVRGSTVFFVLLPMCSRHSHRTEQG